MNKHCINQQNIVNIPNNQVMWLQVGGYVEEYEGLTLATVRGSGHMVPSYQPERALAMVTSFLQGKLPPEKAN